MGPEDSSVCVHLVDGDDAEGFEEFGPICVVGQDGHVKHIGIGEDDVAQVSDWRAVALRRIAIVSRDSDGELFSHGFETPKLILS